jgi:MFS family permease
MSQAPSGKQVTSTPRRALVVAALFGGLAGWLLAVTTEALNVVPPSIPWSAPIGLFVVGALVGAIAWTTHQQIQVRRERMDPQRAVAFLVLGKASALGGALVAGGYLGYALSFVGRLEAEGPRERVVHSLVAIVGGLGLTVAGLLLERACKVPFDEDEERERRRLEEEG